MLTSLIQKGLRFDFSNEKLLVKGDLSILSDTDKNFLRSNKEAIIALIKSQSKRAPKIEKLAGSVPKRLSFTQQSLWLLDKINDGSNHYNLTSAFSLKGNLDYTALNQTFSTILERHESLRSRFLIGDSGEPVQEIQSADNFELSIEAFDNSSENVETFVAQKIETEAHQVFDLTKDLLLSVRLLKIDQEDHVLIVTMHHIASDGWSMGLLVNEFNKLYAAYVNEESNPLAPLKIQYSDYAHWQREWLKDEVLEEHAGFWKKQLTDLPIIHNMPLDYPRPVEQTFNGKTYNSRINKNTLKSLYRFCQSEDASLFMGIHAAFSTLLARYSNEKDIVVGSPIANREKAEIANLVGFFMNILVLRSDFSENPSFRQLLRQSKKTLKEAYAYQQMPFEKIVDALDVKRNLSHNPLFQILLTLQNNQEGEFSLSGMTMEPINNSDGNGAKYDLSLNITEKADELYLSWEYNTDLFKTDTIVNLADHFGTLLDAMLENAEENVLNVNMIGERESEGIYSFLAGEKIELNDEDDTVRWFNRQVVERANEVAVISDDVSYTFNQLEQRVNTIAQQLVEQGVEKGEKVGICLLRNVEMVATIFACFKIGATYIPLDPIYPAERINQIIEDAQPKCIATIEALKNLYLNQVPVENFTFLDSSNSIELNQPAVSRNSSEDIAYIIFTSGTTGKPKGIEVTHGNLNNLLKGFDISFGNDSNQKWLAQTSMNFDISILEIIWTISRGQSIVLQQTNPFKLLSPDKLKPANSIDFSVMFFGADKNPEQKYDLLLETAKFADQNGFTAIWTPERHFGEFGGAFPNPSVISSALAVLTENLNIRSGSVVLPLHDPVRVAEEWSLVDNLSNGRIGLSIASGWQPDDFVFANTDYANRKTELKDRIEELKNLWQGNSVVRKNGINKDFEVKIRPKPIQNELPIWITAAGNPETFKYAGRIGANILTHMLGQSQDDLAKNIAVYHETLRENGFDVEDKKVTLMLHTFIDDSEKVAHNISEIPFKGYLESSIKLMEPLAKEVGIDVETQKDELINLAYQKFSKENTLIGSPESCQKMLFNIQEIGVTEVACLVDFGVENDKVLAGLEKIIEAKNLYNSYNDLNKLLNAENQKTTLDLIDAYQLTHVQMTPSQTKLVLDLHNQKKDKSLASVQHWFIGGEALNEKVVEGMSAITDCKFYNMYGPTETTVWSAWREINGQDIRIGEPVLNTDLLLLNEMHQQVPVGVVGELFIGGSGLANGYHNNTELTNERFIEIDNPHFGNRKFYKTGDLMKMNTDGTFEYIGRKDNQVKVNGYRVELEDIERTISNIGGVKNCKVVPVVHNNETNLSAYIVKEEIVYGDYTELPIHQQARAFYFPDGSTVFHQTDRQLGMLYEGVVESAIYFKHGITLPENGLVLDLGANIGTFSIDVNQRFPSASVIAFEPIPQIFSGLKKNFEHRQIKGRIMNYGLSNKKEKANFFYFPEMAGKSGRFADKDTIIDAVEHYMEYDKNQLKGKGEDRETLQSFYENINGSEEFKEYLNSVYKAEEVECQLTTVSDVIDDLGIKTIDLIKLDVEKSECLVFEGIRPEHWSMIRHVAVEVNGDNNLNIIKDLLFEKGYDVNVDNLVISDANNENEENTYMLYATNLNHGLRNDDSVIQNLNAQVDESFVRAFTKQRLPEYMIPNEVAFVDEIPLMGNGKVDMAKLKSIMPTKSASEEYPKLTNKTELAIYKIWCEVLEKEDLPYHVSIFEAGGNSMKIVLLHEKLQARFNVSFSLVELFRNPTIKQQSRLINNADEKQENLTAKKALNKGKLRRKARGSLTK